ncbi:SdrD B-like domain-containing protein [Persicitalea jodogahamensis]|uniref:SD-repeat containing protein B domain-containing protein n=1 Tax=Persicitalea jodogahamensis TaxID=402147 RepID=A0A8J3D3T1_9BACT|nr:SdrD B-like domain-containing protein [Persicitalea jodogahamensis]GHB68530.1 hypothetical protein GCM10007390_22400 [Persicitalea jodogahamensis]
MSSHYSTTRRIALLLLFSASLFHLPAYAQISGVVYRDFDGSGTRTSVNPNEIGASDVKVRAYVGNSSTPLLSTTDEQGVFSFNATQIPAGSQVKLEFYDLGKMNYSGPYGAESGTSLQFVQAPNDRISFGIFYPAEYCDTRSPVIVTSCFINGDPNAGGNAGDQVALVSFPYEASGLTGPANFPATPLGLVKEVGAIWGVLYHMRSKKFVTSAILKRHAGFGPLGTGGLYLTNYLTGISTPFIDVKTLGIDTGDDPHIGLSADFRDPSLDTVALRKIGKLSLGALAVDESGERIFLSNLNDRKVYSLYVSGNLNTPTRDSVRAFTIPNNCADPGDFRPWALKGYRGDIYVGTVCSGETSGDTAKLRGIVYKFDPKETNPTFTQVLSFPFSFKRGSPDMSVGCVRNYWSTWDDAFPAPCNGSFVLNPQPIISDLEFDVNGDMILGIMDRFGHQSGRDNYGGSSTAGNVYTGFSGGDLMRAGLNADGTYTLEFNGMVGDETGCGTGNDEGPGGGEFYCGDEWVFYGKVAHGEINNGSLALVPGSDEVISTAMDPLSTDDNSVYLASGWQAYRNSGAMAGRVVREFVVYDQDYVGTFGKSAGLGDIVAACNAAPVEIGNRVWLDRNRNGVQDAGEPGVEGIILTLHDAENGFSQVASDTTNAKGEYYFTNANVPGGVEFNHKYEVRISMLQPAITTDSLQPAPPNIGDPVADSDGILVIPGAAPGPGAKNGRLAAALAEEPYVKIEVTSGGIGQNDHTYDYGFGPASKIELVTDSIRICSGEVTVLIAQAASVLPGDSVAFVLYDNIPGTIDEKLNSGTVLGKVAPDGTGLATLPNVIFPVNATRDSASYVVCALLLTRDTAVLGVDNGTVTIGPIPVVVATVDGTLNCTQRIVNLKARSSMSIASFSWTGPGNHVSTDSIAPVSVPGTYVVVGTSAQGCVSSPDTVIVVEEELPPALPTPELVICEPLTSVQLPAIGKGQEWLVSAFNPVTVAVDTVANTASGLSANGTYHIRLREGICISSDSLKITRNPSLALKDSSVTLCASVTVNLPDYIPGYDTLTGQTWHLGSATGATVTDINGITFEQSTTYVLIAANRFGCTDTATVQFIKVPSATLTALANGILTCTQRSVTLTATSDASDIAYLWTGPDNFTSTDSVISVSKSGRYILTGLAADGCSSVADTLDVLEELVPPQLPLASVGICEPTSQVQAPPIGLGQEWFTEFNNAAPIEINNVQNSVSGFTANGVYEVKLREGVCTSAAAMRIVRSAALALRDTVATFCNATAVNLTSYIPGYANLVNPVWHLGSASGAVIPVTNGMQVDESTTYVLTASNQSGCADTASVKFVIQPMPIGFLSITPPTCNDGIPLANGIMTLSGIQAPMRYDLVQDADYSGDATFSTAAAVPKDGNFGSDWASPAVDTPFTMRVFNEAGCFLDLFVSLGPVDCQCPVVCVPVSVKRVKKM